MGSARWLLLVAPVLLSGCFSGELGASCDGEFACDYGLRCLVPMGTKSGVCTVTCQGGSCASGTCAETDYGELCLRECAISSDCDQGHVCGSFEFGDSVCWPSVGPGRSPATDANLEWVTIPGGTFQMGCSPGDQQCSSSETPVHTVAVTAFELLETEVTQSQYLLVAGENPSAHANCDTCPVEKVGWSEANSFCEAIGGRLPTEAEWEYAVRGDSTTRYYCGEEADCLDSIAWLWPAVDASQPVRGKEPNAYGLYDMLGNVWEWSADCWHDNYEGAPSVAYPPWANDGCGPAGLRVVRGGSYFYEVEDGLHVWSRDSALQDMPSGKVGFRCAR